MKKFLALLLVLALTLGLCACSGGGNDAPVDGNTADGGTDGADGGDTTADGPKPLKIMMYVVQSLGTLSCEDLIYEELTKFCEETGSTLDTYECNSDDTKHSTTLPEICQQGYDVIVTGYYNMPEHVERAAEMFPDQKWIMFDCSVNYDLEYTKNVASFACDQNTLAFMAGALAALMTTAEGDPNINPDKVVGWCGAAVNTAIEDFLIGYIEGVHYVDPEIKVLYSYVGDWANTAKCNELATNQFNLGADVVFTVCGGAGFGGCEAAYAAKHYAFGVDTDFGAQLAASGSATADYVVSSAIKQFGRVVYDAMVDFYNGELEFGKHTQYDVTSGYLEMVETDQFKKVVIEGMPEVYEEYQKIVEDLKAGKIQVDTAVGATTEEIEAIKATASAAE